MTPREQIETLVDQKLSAVRKMWIVQAIIATPLLWVALSGWWLLLIPIYLSITYQAAIHIAADQMERSIPGELLQADATDDALSAFEDIKRKLDAGEIQLGPELYDLFDKAGLSLGIVEATSEEKVGRLGDFDIYEWVEMWDPTTKKVERFFFEEVAAKDADGLPVLQHYERKLAALINGAIYTRELQPAQG